MKIVAMLLIAIEILIIFVHLSHGNLNIDRSGSVDNQKEPVRDEVWCYESRVKYVGQVFRFMKDTLKVKCQNMCIEEGNSCIAFSFETKSFHFADPQGLTTSRMNCTLFSSVEKSISIQMPRYGVFSGRKSSNCKEIGIDVHEVLQKCAEPFTFITTGTGLAWHGAYSGDKYIADGTINGKIVYRTIPRGYHFLWFKQMANNEKYWVNDNTHSFPFGALFYGSKCKSDCPYHCKSWNTGFISNIEVPGRGRIADPSLSFVVHSCHENFCFNNGICRIRQVEDPENQILVDQAYCTCKEGFVGEHCETALCMNNEECSKGQICSSGHFCKDIEDCGNCGSVLWIESRKLHLKAISGSYECDGIFNGRASYRMTHDDIYLYWDYYEKSWKLSTMLEDEIAITYNPTCNYTCPDMCINGWKTFYEQSTQYRVINGTYVWTRHPDFFDRYTPIIARNITENWTDDNSLRIISIGGYSTTSKQPETTTTKKEPTTTMKKKTTTAKDYETLTTTTKIKSESTTSINALDIVTPITTKSPNDTMNTKIDGNAKMGNIIINNIIHHQNLPSGILWNDGYRLRCDNLHQTSLYLIAISITIKYLF